MAGAKLTMNSILVATIHTNSRRIFMASASARISININNSTTRNIIIVNVAIRSMQVIILHIITIIQTIFKSISTIITTTIVTVSAIILSPVDIVITTTVQTLIVMSTRFSLIIIMASKMAQERPKRGP